MNIIIFYKEEDEERDALIANHEKEEDEERDALIANHEEGMEETSIVATASLVAFFL
jgi:hypothetical protein